MGIVLMPWQDLAGRYLMARNPDGSRPYREVGITVARQNGKTTMVKPFVVHALLAGKKVMHIAQTRELPRHMFGVIADALSSKPDLFPRRRGKVIWPRYGAGQEEIILENGGMYRLAASRTGGARGWSNDIVIIDELREMDSFDIINAVEPTLLMSPDPLMVYLSNAGTDTSAVLNSVRERSGKDPGLAYLEWSADPDLDPADRAGWAQANPALGHYPAVLKSLESAYTRHRLANTMPTFETEHLCRWVTTVLPPVVTAAEWEAARGELPTPQVRPVMGVKVDFDGRRASAAIAWRDGDTVCVRSFAEDVTSPLDLDAFAAALQPLMREHRVGQIAFDPQTDLGFARNFEKHAEPITGQKYQDACREFVRRVTGRMLRHDDDGTITEDLAYTVRRDVPTGWLAVRAGTERTNTAAEAAIRAVWLAASPNQPRPRVH